ncbi:hypothetical protein Q9K01_02495 [Qipengyuania sp. DY56-A-20]|jgi:hypothetical protein|uniref:Lipoprotein n=1 Tax=Qipengyuania benthica TaxID=3067651 RepID=A0ABT9H598_9SPHN|nr:hypothetical protein [Qipengyuania sp. DY56-A-20]MDP4538491.1 hypothetical protein [Qipengyuania sp. DY56-A-20]
MPYLRITAPLLILLLAACGGKEAVDPVGTAELTGLYLGDGEGKQQDRICMVKAPSGAVRFGIVTLELDRAACSGIGRIEQGRVEQSGAELRLVMAGEEDCVVPASVSGTRVTLAASVPEGCSYYCGPGAMLAGKSFEKTQDSLEGAMSADDLVGNPLCR